MAAFSRDLPEVKKGDEIKAEDWNRLVQYINRNRLMFGQNCGIDAQETVSGIMIRNSRKLEFGYLGQTTTSFAPRSGSSLASGSVALLDMNTSGTVSSAAAETVKAWNFTSFSGGLSANVFVWVAIDPGGEFVITAAEC